MKKEFYVPLGDDDDDDDKNKKKKKQKKKTHQPIKPYVGRVISYNPHTQFYQILYEDGDREEMERHDLVPLLERKSST